MVCIRRLDLDALRYFFGNELADKRRDVNRVHGGRLDARNTVLLAKLQQQALKLIDDIAESRVHVGPEIGIGAESFRIPQHEIELPYRILDVVNDESKALVELM